MFRGLVRLMLVAMRGRRRGVLLHRVLVRRALRNDG